MLASITHNPSCIEALQALVPSAMATPTPTPGERSGQGATPARSNSKPPGGEEEGCEEAQKTHTSVEHGTGLGTLVETENEFGEMKVFALKQIRKTTPTHIRPYISLGEGEGLSGEDLNVSTAATPPSSQDDPTSQGAGATPLDDDHTPLLDEATPPPDPASQEMDCAPSPGNGCKKTVDFFTQHFLQQPDVVGVAEGGVDEGGASLTDKVRSAVESALGSVAEEIRQDVMDKVDMEVLERISSQLAPPATTAGQQGQGSASSDPAAGAPFGTGLSLLPPTIFKRKSFTDVPSLFGTSSEDSSTATPTTTSAANSSESVVQPLEGPLMFGKGSSLSSVNLESLHISSSTTIQSDPSLGSFNAIETLFSDWSAIVTTVLGCNPSPTGGGHAHTTPTEGGRATPQFSSVHLLDSFTTDLLLNCPTQVRVQ